MKLAECIILFLFFTILGYDLSSRLEKRIKQLKELEKAIMYLEREIDYKLTPLGEAFCQLAKNSQIPWNLFFNELSRNFQKEAKENKLPEELFKNAIKKMKLYHPWEKDMDILVSLGRGLGQLDKKNQILCLRMCLKELENLLEEAEDERKKKGNLYRTLGVCMGVLGIILIL